MKKENKREKRQGDTADPRQDRDNVFDPALIERLVSLMTANDLTELNLTQGRCGIQLRRERAVGPTVPAAAVADTPAALSPQAAAAAPPVDKADDSSIQVITSPMVGTFYTAPSPEKPAFVKVGDVISPDTTVCIIEAMKVYNEIQGEISGKVVAVLAKNGEAVDFGKPLFKIDTRG